MRNTGRKAFKHPTEWTRAVNDVLCDIIRSQKRDKTDVCEEAGYSNNFLAKLESGTKKMISLDEIEPIAQVLGMRTVEIALLAEEKKTKLSGTNYHPRNEVRQLQHRRSLASVSEKRDQTPHAWLHFPNRSHDF